ncbi:PID-CTERM protein-sorting domain-containing protein [Lutibacter sp.]|uniref:PID-CTERM protein-sorting domain-containing protein n=1 Tax=Lutibacter sp. TaxID=1925666 RepID=UPI0027330782|nr:hypothetical protein [Lutibacter sp.]MDP3313612.1 hypothetical protein [Lutibacter sp.]
MKLKINKYFLSICFFLFLKTVIIAQPPIPVGLPIDGGLLYLLAAGLVYGVFNLKKKN